MFLKEGLNSRNLFIKIFVKEGKMDQRMLRSFWFMMNEFGKIRIVMPKISESLREIINRFKQKVFLTSFLNKSEFLN